MRNRLAVIAAAFTIGCGGGGYRVHERWVIAPHTRWYPALESKPTNDGKPPNAGYVRFAVRVPDATDPSAKEKCDCASPDPATDIDKSEGIDVCVRRNGKKRVAEIQITLPKAVGENDQVLRRYHMRKQLDRCAISDDASQLLVDRRLPSAFLTSAWLVALSPGMRIRLERGGALLFGGTSGPQYGVGAVSFDVIAEEGGIVFGAESRVANVSPAGGQPQHPEGAPSVFEAAIPQDLNDTISSPKPRRYWHLVLPRAALDPPNANPQPIVDLEHSAIFIGDDDDTLIHSLYEIDRSQSEIEKSQSEIEKSQSEIEKSESEIEKLKPEIKKSKSGGLADLLQKHCHGDNKSADPAVRKPRCVLFPGHATAIVSIPVSVQGQSMYVALGTTLGDVLTVNIGRGRVTAEELARHVRGHLKMKRRFGTELVPLRVPIDDAGTWLDLPLAHGDVIRW